MKGLPFVAATLATVALVGCVAHQTEVPALSGPSDLALSLNMTATPDSIRQDGESQSSIRITAKGPDGKGITALPLRVDMQVNGVAQDFGTLSARTVVTGTDGTAFLVYTAPPSPVAAVPGTCLGVPGTCVTIVATPTGTNFGTLNAVTGTIRLVPPGVILPPAATPTASFTFSPSTVSANLPVTFDASASTPGTGATNITSYAWAFGDGQTATGKTVTHAFASQNTFSVVLTVTNDRALSASTTQQVTVNAAALPTPSFTFSPNAPGVGDTVFFNASTSTPGQGHSTITSYRWTFGDGGTGSGVTTTHRYTVAGIYTVQLTVTDESGQSNTLNGTQITVGNPPVPIAKFTFSPSTPAANLAVIFDASTSTPAGGQGGQAIVSYTWTFGDGTAPVTVATPIVSHTFGFGGVFAVNLVVKDSAGRTGSVTNSITVSSGDATLPTATILVSQNPIPVNQEVSFTANVTSVGTGATKITNYMWDFGDGRALFGGPTSSNVGVTYTRTGTFQVKLTVTNDAGKSSSSVLTVVVQ